MRTSTTRGWERAAERRTGLSRLLAQALELSRTVSDTDARRSKLERDVGYLLNARSVSIREGQVPHQTAAVRERGGVITVPLLGPADPPLVLEIRTAYQDLDAWARQHVMDVVRIVSLALQAGSNTASVEPAATTPHAQSLHRLIGRSPTVTRLRHEIRRMASTDFTVLIEGESGSGKELVARLIHEESRRKDGPFIGINCAALVETLLEAELFGIEDRTATGVRGRRGKFELADEGTLFLDEVSDLSPAAQAKLLRALQERSVERVGGHATRVVNTRIVVATNQSLKELVAARTFRADLFYRLSGVEVHVPPLRARRGDVAILAHHFLDRHREVRSIGISTAAMDALSTYTWPGNVRELERVVERAVTLATSNQITPDDLPPKVTGDYVHVLEPSLRDDHTMRTWGSRYARLVLERCDNNKRRACRVLGISYHTLQAYLAHQGSASGADALPKPTEEGQDTQRPSECR